VGMAALDIQARAINQADLHPAPAGHERTIA
jgi:hypothetical protein